MFVRLIKGGGFLSLIWLMIGNAYGDWELNMTQGVTPVSHQVYHLHMIILGICVAIGVVVFGAMFYSIFKHRKSKGVVPAQFHESTTMEIVWTVIPFLILIIMAVPATRTLIAMYDTSKPDLSIKVTGYQWKWKYDYLDEGISFFSSLDPASQEASQRGSGKDPFQVANYLREVDEPVVVPVNKKIRFLTTSADVIHAWWVPDLGWKRDAIPGFINESWALIERPGVYRGQCAELCGKGHAFMPIVVEAKSEKDYRKWVAMKKQAMAEAEAASGKEWTKDDLMAKGKQLYSVNCAACHQANGQGLPGVFPALAGSKVATGPIAEHLKTVLNGRAGTAMAAFRDQLNDADLAAIITYERNAWGNNTGDVVQPADIKAAR